MGEYRTSGRVALRDVTGDGYRDLLFLAPLEDVLGVNWAGGVYVWAGGPALTGTRTETAHLIVPGAPANSVLGTGSKRGLTLRDLNADGVADLLLSSSEYGLAGSQRTGALFVWSGGSTMSGQKGPEATLLVPGALTDDGLTALGGVGLLRGDVNGDGVADFVAGASSADLGGKANVGAVYVWDGSVSLAGTLSPSVTLSVPGATAGDQLGFLNPYSFQGLQLVDVDADGVLDVVAGAALARFDSKSAAGAVYVWKGKLGFPAAAPTAALGVPGCAAGDKLGHVAGYFGDQGLRFADVTGDGRLDLVAGARFADVGGVVDAGVVYVWAGPLNANAAPTRKLIVTGAVAGDRLGN